MSELPRTHSVTLHISPCTSYPEYTLSVFSLKPNILNKFVHSHVLRPDLSPVKHDIVEQYILYHVILIKSDKLHARMIFDDIGLPVRAVLKSGQSRIDGGRSRSDIPEYHVSDVPTFFRLCPPCCPDPAGDQTACFLDTDILEGLHR